jgi:hypothetical protein
MTRTPLTIVIAAAAALAGCNKQSHTIVEGDPADNGANAAANAAPVELPPSITASKIYRCKDNSVVYVDWLSDNKSANFRADKDGTPLQLKADEAGKPMTGEGGYSLSGTATAATITLARPGHASQSCKA